MVPYLVPSGAGIVLSQSKFKLSSSMIVHVTDWSCLGMVPPSQAPAPEVPWFVFSQ